jgi:MOSC domain-containing protein YiiM
MRKDAGSRGGVCETRRMFEGRLVGIFVTATAGEPMKALDEVQVTPQGLAGDRYESADGTFSSNAGGGRHVTLIEREAIDAVNAEGDVSVTATSTRRNLLTEGVPLNHLVGRTFRVGDVVLRGVRLNEPCAYLEGKNEPGFRQAMLHRCGLRAEVVETGVIRVGDVIA